MNLQFVNEIVFASLCYDYSKIKQAKARIRRLGQEEDINYTYILSRCSINDMILDNLNKKQTLSDLITEKLEKGEVEQWLKSI